MIMGGINDKKEGVLREERGRGNIPVCDSALSFTLSSSPFSSSFSVDIG